MSHREFLVRYLRKIKSGRSTQLRLSNLKSTTSLLEEGKTNLLYERIPSRETSERLKLELHTSNTVSMTRIIEQSNDPILIFHRANSGLGHRMGKMANAYHLVKAMNLTNGLLNSWGWECKGTKDNGDTMDIFYYLFGNDRLSVPPSSIDGPIHSPFLIELVKDIQNAWRNSTNSIIKSLNNTNTNTNTTNTNTNTNANKNVTQEHQVMRLVNDIPGYYLMTPRDVMKQYTPTSIRQKRLTNFELYHRLRGLYRDNHIALEFIKKHDYASHYVFGFHVRTGNGEKGDFVKKKRFMYILEMWIQSFSKMMMDFISTEQYKEISGGKPPLLFVSTDTTKAITFLEQYLTNPNHSNRSSNGTKVNMSIPVIHFPQERMKRGTGVTYNAKFNSSKHCYQSWSDQFMDMTLLSASDVVIAGTYSTFTQSMPLTMMIGNPNPSHNKLFCELGRIATMMQCFTHYDQWLATHARMGEKSHSPPIWIGAKDGPTHPFESRQEFPIYDLWTGIPFMKKIFNIEREKMRGYLIPKY